MPLWVLSAEDVPRLPVVLQSVRAVIWAVCFGAVGVFAGR